MMLTQNWTCKWIMGITNKTAGSLENIHTNNTIKTYHFIFIMLYYIQRRSCRSAISWSCSDGTGTPLTDLSLWICWNVCLCDSKFLNTSCKVYPHIVTISWILCLYPKTLRCTYKVLPYAALVFCVEHWLSPQELVEWKSPPSEPSLPYEARLQSLPGDQEGICPDGGASPAAAIDIFFKKKTT